MYADVVVYMNLDSHSAKLEPATPNCKCMYKPCNNPFQEALAWCSQVYKLNPWSEKALHEASCPEFVVNLSCHG